VLIIDDQGQGIGAVGISGDASDKDEFCAIEAIRAAGLTAEPSLPTDNWNDSGL
jgi:glc operon protein GlcG